MRKHYENISVSHCQRYLLLQSFSQRTPTHFTATGPQCMAHPSRAPIPPPPHPSTHPGACIRPISSSSPRLARLGKRLKERPCAGSRDHYGAREHNYYYVTKLRKAWSSGEEKADSAEPIISGRAMPLYYCLVARGKIVLCDHAEVSGNFEALSQSILQTKREDGSKIRYSLLPPHTFLTPPFSHLSLTLLPSHLPLTLSPPHTSSHTWL